MNVKKLTLPLRMPIPQVFTARVATNGNDFQYMVEPLEKWPHFIQQMADANPSDDIRVYRDQGNIIVDTQTKELMPNIDFAKDGGNMLFDGTEKLMAMSSSPGAVPPRAVGRSTIILDTPDQIISVGFFLPKTTGNFETEYNVTGSDLSINQVTAQATQDNRWFVMAMGLQIGGSSAWPVLVVTPL